MEQIPIILNIIFENTKLRKYCTSKKNAVKKWGQRRGTLLLKRLDEIHDSDNLMDLTKIPQARCHKLTGNLQGKWSVELEHPYRLIFEPLGEPIPKLSNGGIDLKKVTAVKILGVLDTHG